MSAKESTRGHDPSKRRFLAGLAAIVLGGVFPKSGQAKDSNGNDRFPPPYSVETVSNREREKLLNELSSIGSKFFSKEGFKQLVSSGEFTLDAMDISIEIDEAKQSKIIKFIRLVDGEAKNMAEIYVSPNYEAAVIVLSLGPRSKTDTAKYLNEFLNPPVNFIRASNVPKVDGQIRTLSEDSSEAENAKPVGSILVGIMTPSRLATVDPVSGQRYTEDRRVTILDDGVVWLQYDRKVLDLSDEQSI